MSPQPKADPLGALLDAAADRAVERVLERLVELRAEPQRHVLTDDDVCALLHVSRPTLRKLLADGLPFAQMGSVRRYVHADVIAWLRSQLPAGHDLSDAESVELERERTEVFGK